MATVGRRQVRPGEVAGHWLTVDCLPVAQPRQRHTVIAGRPHNYTPVSHPVNVFKATIRLAAKEQGVTTAQGPVRLWVQFIMPRPKSKVWKTKEMLGYPHTSKPDLDNLIKAVKDALHGIAWRDDCQVCDLVASKIVASGVEQPGVRISLTTLPNHEKNGRIN